MMAKVPLAKSMSDILISEGFQNVYFPVIPEENILGNAVYIGVQEYDSGESTIEDQYETVFWQIIVRGSRLTPYKSAFDTMDNIKQYLIKLPARFTINGNEYSDPTRISGPTYFKDSNDRDVFTMNLRTYQNPLED